PPGLREAAAPDADAAGGRGRAGRPGGRGRPSDAVQGSGRDRGAGGRPRRLDGGRVRRHDGGEAGGPARRRVLRLPGRADLPRGVRRNLARTVRARPGARGAPGGGGVRGGAWGAAGHRTAGLGEPVRRRRPGLLAGDHRAALLRLAARLAAGDGPSADAAAAGRDGRAVTPGPTRPPPGRRPAPAGPAAPSPAPAPSPSPVDPTTRRYPCRCTTAASTTKSVPCPSIPSWVRR